MRPKIVVVLTLLAFVAVACAQTPTDAGSSPSEPAIAHPTGADQLILRVELVGGFVAPETTFARTPSFSLMGDGTMVEPGVQTEIYPGQALPPLFARSISEDGIQAILGAAIDAGLDRDATLGDLGTVGVSDMPTTVFTLSSNGETHRVEAYALGVSGEERPQGMSQETWAARQALSSFEDRLGRLPEWLPEGSIGADAPYGAPAAALLVRNYQGDPGLTEEPIAWPLDTGLAGFGSAEPSGRDGRCGTVTGTDWEALRPVAQRANTLSPWTSDGRRYAITFRPLLPDQHGC